MYEQLYLIHRCVNVTASRASSCGLISAEARSKRMRRFFGSTGSISRVTIESQALKNNMLDDSWVRAVDVYVPAGHDGEGLPLLVDLVGFTSSGLSPTNWVGFREK